MHIGKNTKETGSALQADVIGGQKAALISFSSELVVCLLHVNDILCVNTERNPKPDL